MNQKYSEYFELYTLGLDIFKTYLRYLSAIL